MMKKLILLCTVLFSYSSLSTIDITIKNLCEDSDYHFESVLPQQSTNLGFLTVKLLKENGIPYDGAEYGFRSILNTPVDFDSYEDIDTYRMRSYGWCYTVNGKLPDYYADKYMVEPNDNLKVVWYFSYSEFYKNEAISYCVPVYKDPQPFVCK